MLLPTSTRSSAELACGLAASITVCAESISCGLELLSLPFLSFSHAFFICVPSTQHNAMGIAGAEKCLPILHLINCGTLAKSFPHYGLSFLTYLK